ncbi:hypothetical protein OHB01_19650 [Microbispora hainanensis]|uniref:hypothetical protein n=1 Tax=Microbispora TaxID=2005 RepID=UPI001159D99A|nr:MULTISPECIES: hypothetical protein [Microbispora]NJP24856.1 hypothetical protein [Microbispora sp. CL1-1]TQS14319.1 hypothetical protein FLW53_11685 [Microbispora sp. SCL1-1]
MRITYPVPAQTSSVFVVVTDRTPTDLTSIVPWRMGPSHRRAARDALGTPRLRLEAFRSTRSPWRRMDLSTEDLKRVRRARHHVVVTSTAPVEEQPEAAQVARAAARGIAEAYHGVLYDPLTGAAVYHCAECPGERRDFDLGDDWLGWRVSCADEEHACVLGLGTAAPVGADAGGGCSCLVTISRGLRRFGLPEIALTGLACAHSLCAVTVLRAVAESLLAGHFAWLSSGSRWQTETPPPCRAVARRLRMAGIDYAVLSGGAGPDSSAQVPGTEHGAEPGMSEGLRGRLVVWAGRPDRESGRMANAEHEAEPGTVHEENGLLRVRLTPAAAARSCLKLGLPGGHGGNPHPHHTAGLLVA